MRTNSSPLLIARLASGINGLLGACMMLAPLFTGAVSDHNPLAWGILILGGIVMTFGMTRLFSPEELPALSWMNLAVGASIVLSPWLLRFAADEDRMWAAVAVGGTVMILAALSVKGTVSMRQRLFRA